MAGLLGKAKTMRRRLSLAAAKTMGFKDALPPEIAVDDDELDALRKAHAALLKDVDDLGSGFSEHVAMLRDYYANGETLGDVAASSFRAERKRASSTLASASYFKRRSLRRCQNQLSSSSSRPRETGSSSAPQVLVRRRAGPARRVGRDGVGITRAVGVAKTRDGAGAAARARLRASRRRENGAAKSSAGAPNVMR